MAEATLFFRNNRNYSVGSINIDILLSESYNFGSTITQFNIEDGSDISDHIRKQLFNGSVTARVTNFSLNQDVLLSNRAQEAYSALKKIWEDEELVDIVLIYDVFTNVGISNIGIPRSVGMGESIEFSVTFQEVNIVKLQEVTIVANVKLNGTGTDAKKQASPKLNTGKQQSVLR